MVRRGCLFNEQIIVLNALYDFPYGLSPGSPKFSKITYLDDHLNHFQGDSAIAAGIWENPYLRCMMQAKSQMIIKGSFQRCTYRILDSNGALTYTPAMLKSGEGKRRMDPILVEIKQDRPGFDKFIGSWVCAGERNAVVDVGPAHSVDRLIESLKAMNWDRVDFILLTHIHLDHAGGLTHFLGHFPMANVICHSKAMRHLVDPSMLWAGSKKVLGEVAEFYGPMKPVAKEKLIPHTEASIKDLEIIETPGHAPHHLSFRYQGHLFVGEAGGNYFRIQDLTYVRPATPPKFFLEECLKSVDRLLSLEDQPICYAHFGSADSSQGMLNPFREQLTRWGDIIGKEISKGEQHLLERCMDKLLEKDPDLGAFDAMQPDEQERERFFMANSVSGYLEFLGHWPHDAHHT
jgi:glyoxylase-like metal-dependent hydrolase (beta-lactamase superfamily II)